MFKWIADTYRKGIDFAGDELGTSGYFKEKIVVLKHLGMELSRADYNLYHKKMRFAEQFSENQIALNYKICKWQFGQTTTDCIQSEDEQHAIIAYDMINDLRIHEVITKDNFAQKIQEMGIIQKYKMKSVVVEDSDFNDAPGATVSYFDKMTYNVTDIKPKTKPKLNLN
jgi:hypothetical protein